nr:hypothetical protein [Tanacetum cinerariifolium]
MALTFVDTYNMVAFLIKSDASEGFDQIVDFLNAQVIQYALMVNPIIYVSCIKKFWSSVSIKRLNDVVILQALIDRKKVIITEDSIRKALRLDDTNGVDCLSNEEIFAELARIGYEKPSIKLTFYKAFFLSQWKFLIHTVLQCMSSKRTAWNEFSSFMASAIICLATAQDVEDAAKDENDDNEVSTEPNTLSPTPDLTPPPSPTQEHTCATLIKQVANLEQDKVAQAIEITKLKQRVRRRMHPNKGGGIAALDANKDVTLEAIDAKVAMDADVQGSMHDTDEAEPAKLEEVIEVVTAATLMTEVVTTSATTITTDQVPKASALRRRNGVII